MNEYTPTPPTRPGLYRWRQTTHMRDMPIDVFRHTSGPTLVVVVDGEVREADKIGGLWYGPFVHVSEIEKAWDEAAAEDSEGSPVSYWDVSRAKGVMNGQVI